MALTALEATNDDLPDEIEDLWSDFRRSLVRRGRAPATIGLYRRKFVDFWRWAVATGAPLDPGQIDHHVVNRWLEDLMTTPVVRNGAPMMTTDAETGRPTPQLPEPSTLRIAYRNLRPFFSWYAREFDTTNPFDRADAPGDDRARPIPVVELDDVRRLLATCAGSAFIDRRDTAILRVLADTGARLGEIVHLGTEDWNRRADLITLTGKTGTRIVPVAASTGEALSRYLRARKGHRYAASPAMWLGERGRLGQFGISQVLRRRCIEAGVDHVNPHRLRHTWAHEFRAAGGSEGDLMYLAGWTTTAMAHRYGNSAAAERAQRAARAIALGDQL